MNGYLFSPVHLEQSWARQRVRPSVTLKTNEKWWPQVGGELQQTTIIWPLRNRRIVATVVASAQL